MKTFPTFQTPKPVLSNAVTEVIFSRRSVRNYFPKPVDRHIIDFLIEAARMAPSAMNIQPYRFVVVDNAKLIKEFSAQIVHIAKPFFDLAHTTSHIKEHADPIFYSAPVVIFLLGPKTDDWAAIDIGMCAQNIMLAAKSIGLETCPVGFARLIERSESYTMFKAESKECIHLAIALGYSSAKPDFHGRKINNSEYLDTL